MCAYVYFEVWRRKSWSASQMPPSKRWLLLASALLTFVHDMNRTENKCVPPYGGSDYKAVQIFCGVYYRAKSKNEFQHSDIRSFCLKGLILSFSGVLTMRLYLTVQLRQSCLSGPWVQTVLCTRFKSATEDQLGTHGYVANKSLSEASKITKPQK